MAIKPDEDFNLKSETDHSPLSHNRHKIFQLYLCSWLRGASATDQPQLPFPTSFFTHVQLVQFHVLVFACKHAFSGSTSAINLQNLCDNYTTSQPDNLFGKGKQNSFRATRNTNLNKENQVGVCLVWFPRI